MRAILWGAALTSLLLGSEVHAGGADVGGYFRVAARPDLQGGNGRLGYWNLYGRLMNEGSYGMLELRYDILEPQPQSFAEWASLHVRIEGGSIANADPSADYPAALVGLGATVVTDRREIVSQDFFTDFFETALEEGELITRVAFPVPERAAYAKLPNPASRYAVVGVMVCRGADGVRVAGFGSLA